MHVWLLGVAMMVGGIYMARRHDDGLGFGIAFLGLLIFCGSLLVMLWNEAP